MQVYYDKEKKTHNVNAKDVRGILKELNILKNAVIVVVNKEVVTEDYAFKKGDNVEIISVVSGG